MKKLISLAISVLMILGCFTGITGFASAEGKPVITVWMETPTASVKAYMEAFQSEDYDVEYVYYASEDLKNQVRIALAAGEAPDITVANTGTFFNEIMEGGYALALDDYAAEYGWLNRVEAEYLGNCSYNGMLYGLPLATQCTWGLLFYNADFFAQNGLEISMYPTNAEVIALCDQVRELGKQPIAFGNVDLWPGVLLLGDYFVQEADQTLVDQLISGEAKWDESPVVRDCFEALAELGQAGAFTIGYEVQDHSAAIESFVNETCVMMYMGTWWIQYVSGGFSGIDFTVGTVASPRFEGVEMANAAQLFANQATFIYSGTKNADYAANWLDYYASDENAAAQYADSTAQTFSPSYNATLEIDPQFSDSEAYNKSYEIPKINYFDWHFPTAVTDTLKVSIQKLFSGDITVDQALADVEAIAQDER